MLSGYTVTRVAQARQVQAVPRDRTSGLLIVSADDWGHDSGATDAIHECFQAGAVSSVSAMVHMSDSARAAELAIGGGEPVGLHINLTEAFTGPDCPATARSRQARIVGYFAGPRRRMWGLSPTLFKTIEDCIAEQLETFRNLYGREPTHVDGHQHVHKSLGVLLSRTLPSGLRMRPSLTFMPGEKSLPNRLARALVNRVMRMRFRIPRYLFDLREAHPAFGGAGLDRKLALADQHSVEFMTHPALADERAVLLGDDWAAHLRGRRIGGYPDL
jgi:predicted glycoside hydrolase/deacetylase ChbG (UPF0249 family)